MHTTGAKMGAQGSCLGQQVGVGLPSWGRSTRQLMRRHGGEGIIALGDDKKLGLKSLFSLLCFWFVWCVLFLFLV